MFKMRGGGDQRPFKQCFKKTDDLVQAVVPKVGFYLEIDMRRPHHQKSWLVKEKWSSGL